MVKKESNESVVEKVQKYYRETLSTNKDLKTSACCTVDSFPDYIKEIISDIHEEVRSKYYGCGVVAPEVLKGKTILDIGCGTGHDCYILSKLVGPHGRVIGVDMTDEQLEVANRYIEYHRKKFGYSVANVEFKKGFIEDLGVLDIKKNSIDIVISNCVVNLSTQKAKTLKGVFDVLKPGGEFYFSDVYSDRRIPQNLAKNEVLYGECLSGALYINDFKRLARTSGFNDSRVVKKNPLVIEDKKIKEKIGNIVFYSITHRLFKIAELEDLCEDYGQSVIYKGTIEMSPHGFILDDHHYFERGRQKTVCGNTYLMLKQSRYQKHFDFYGDFDCHYGLFPDCEPTYSPLNSTKGTETSSCC
ncbi:MAG: methyltransferase domain-containing protein [Gammaproteobacteria bacterium]|nr:methyltransferase domain-containing protein [Gammaproteobacteria bacterium]